MRTAEQAKLPGSLPGPSPFWTSAAPSSSSSAITTGTTCGRTGSSTHGGGVRERKADPGVLVRTSSETLMHPRLPLTRRAFGPAIAFVALLLVLLDAPQVIAQSPPLPAAADPGEFRLTMPLLRKALPILHAPGAEKECDKPGEEYRDLLAMSLAQMERRIADCPPIRKAAAAQKASLRELALTYKALLIASYRIAEEESAKARRSSAAPLPAGAVRENVALMRANDAELARLSKASE